MSDAATLSPDALARACADAMWQDDRASQGLGMQIIDIGPGRATLQMTIQPHMVNGHGIAHGGFIFTLADSAFAFACNSRNAVTVAQHCDVTFHAPGRAGEMLVAEAREVLAAYPLLRTSRRSTMVTSTPHLRPCSGIVSAVPAAFCP